MSLHATTLLSRHLTPHLRQTLQPTRYLSTVKGSGLRRIRNSGRTNNASTQSSSVPLPKSTEGTATTTTTSSSNPLKVDPHAIANEMIQGSSSARPSGSEAVASLTSEQKISNYAMASGLLAFVSYVFYYSLASVGGVENAKQVILGKDESSSDSSSLTTNAGFAEFLKEAKEGMAEEELRKMQEKKARVEADKLVDLDRTETGGTLSAEEEREMARVAGFEEGDGGGEKRKRPLWRRVVFFWRRD